MLTTIDEVLDIVHRTGPDLVNGNSNHSPMAAEALFALGRPDAVLPWLEGYKSRFQERPQTRDPISPGDWQASLGDRNRVADWVACFDRELAEAPWQAVLQGWVPRLRLGNRPAGLSWRLLVGSSAAALQQEPQALRQTPPPR